jgi:hypothetical protein
MMAAYPVAALGYVLLVGDTWHRSFETSKGEGLCGANGVPLSTEWRRSYPELDDVCAACQQLATSPPFEGPP